MGKTQRPGGAGFSPVLFSNSTLVPFINTDIFFTPAIEPRPDGCRRLSGYDDIYWIRVGNFRVTHKIDGKQIIVVILKISHRKEVYR